MINTQLKVQIHERCLAVLQSRIAETERGIDEIRLEAQSGAKSSAGDKHETGRAMADLEIEKRQQALHNLLQMRDTLERIDPSRQHQLILPGSLVDTNKGLIYIAAGLGKVLLNDQEVLVISYSAPVVAKLKETPVGGTAVFNGVKYIIHSIT